MCGEGVEVETIVQVNVSSPAAWFPRGHQGKRLAPRERGKKGGGVYQVLLSYLILLWPPERAN